MLVSSAVVCLHGKSQTWTHLKNSCYCKDINNINLVSLLSDNSVRRWVYGNVMSLSLSVTHTSVTIKVGIYKAMARGECIDVEKTLKGQSRKTLDSTQPMVCNFWVSAKCSQWLWTRWANALSDNGSEMPIVFNEIYLMHYQKIRRYHCRV